MRNKFLPLMRACEELYERAYFSTVPGNFQCLILDGEKIAVKVKSTVPPNAIIAMEHGADIKRKLFLRLCAVRLKQEDAPALIIYKFRSWGVKPQKKTEPNDLPF